MQESILDKSHAFWGMYNGICKFSLFLETEHIHWYKYPFDSIVGVCRFQIASFPLLASNTNSIDSLGPIQFHNF